jgi:hypothetical protein
MTTHLCTKGTSPKLHVWNCDIDKCVHFYNKICPEHEPKEVSVPPLVSESLSKKVPNRRNESASRKVT